MNTWRKEKGEQREEKKRKKETRRRRRRRDCFVKWQEQHDRFLSSLSNSKLSNKKKEEEGKWRWNSLFLSFSLSSAYYQLQRSSGKGDKDKYYYVFAEFLLFLNKEMNEWKERRNDGTLINRSKILSAMWFTSNDWSSSFGIHWSEDFCLFEKHSRTIK